MVVNESLIAIELEYARFFHENSDSVLLILHCKSNGPYM